MTTQPNTLHQHAEITITPAISMSLSGQSLSLGYANKRIAEDLNIAIPPGSFTAIIGPNGCGKSTLLRTLCRLLKPLQGEVWLNGKAIHQYPTKEVARQIGLLPQTAIAPEGITVTELVSRGRYPHQSLLKQWSQADQFAIDHAMQVTGITELANHLVDELSGGQRQRVWIAMVLAQDTPLILLDEPTTYLDITHQIELLELFSALNQRSGRTLVAVLHDINHACRYASHLIALNKGNVIAEGKPADIVTPALMKAVFDLDCMVIDDPVTHTPLIVPHRIIAVE
jgi:ABC-type cobalamin/Fe3+-siderophores transport system ATPase subunit